MVEQSEGIAGEGTRLEQLQQLGLLCLLVRQLGMVLVLVHRQVLRCVAVLRS